MVHRTSACSPIGHSPKSYFRDGNTDNSTGSAVPVRATSTNEPVTIVISGMSSSAESVINASGKYHMLYIDIYTTIYNHCEQGGYSTTTETNRYRLWKVRILCREN